MVHSYSIGNAVCLKTELKRLSKPPCRENYGITWRQNVSSWSRHAPCGTVEYPWDLHSTPSTQPPRPSSSAIKSSTQPAASVVRSSIQPAASVITQNVHTVHITSYIHNTNWPHSPHHFLHTQHKLATQSTSLLTYITQTGHTVHITSYIHNTNWPHSPHHFLHT